MVSGYEDGSFCPNKPVTREEFVKMATLAFPLPQGEETVAFADVDGGAWYAPYVAAGVKSGLITGVAPNLFGTGSLITREDAAVILYRAALKKGLSLTPKELAFGDKEEISGYAKEAVSALCGAGVVSGTGSGFSPKTATTRQEAAQLIYMLKKLEVSDHA